MGRRWWMAGCLALMAMSAGGCALLYFAAGKGKAKAMYTFPKTQKVLVMVEVREGIAAPPYLSSNLADSIGKHLWKYHAVEQPLVNQDKLILLQTAHADEFKKMGIADIAQATGADLVLHVNITQFATPTTTDGEVDEGYAEAYVKVINRKGERLFGALRLAAHDNEALLTDRDIPKTAQDMIDQISTQTGRLFHDYDVEDKEMNPSNLDPDRQMGHPGE